jgi:hypothetical protein
VSFLKGHIDELCRHLVDGCVPDLVANQQGELDLHPVWGRVVPDIPAFYRELVAALTE